MLEEVEFSLNGSNSSSAEVVVGVTPVVMFELLRLLLEPTEEAAASVTGGCVATGGLESAGASKFTSFSIISSIEKSDAAEVTFCAGFCA